MVYDFGLNRRAAGRKENWRGARISVSGYETCSECYMYLSSWPNHNPCMPRIPIRPFPFPPRCPPPPPTSLQQQWRPSASLYSLNCRGFYTIPRVPECLSLRPNWLPQPPYTQASVPPPPPPGTKGGSNTCLRVRGWGEPIRTTEECVELQHFSLLYGKLIHLKNHIQLM